MMNIVALSLVLTTLATAGVWSPALERVNNIKEDIIAKEGHRTVVIEFEKDDGNTKVSISPPEAHEGLHKSSEVDEKGKHVKEKLEEEGNDHITTPRELVCDAFGKCKQKVASAIGKTKEAVSEKAHEAADKVHGVDEEAKETVEEAFGKVKNTVARKAHEASDKAHETKERAKDAATEISGKAKEAVAEKAMEVKEGVKEKAEEVKKGAEEAVDITKTLKGDVERNASRKMETTKRKASEKAKEAEEKIESEVEHGVHRVKEKGKWDLNENLRRGREVVYGFFGCVFSPESMAPGIGILQVLGSAIACGMSIWVTFVSSYILAGALPRQQFAIFYPVYFRAMAYSVGTVLVGHLLCQRKRLSSGAGEMVQGFNLVASLLMLLFNLWYLEPLATKAMFERMKLEKEEGKALERSAAERSARVVDSITEPSGAKVLSTTTIPAPSSNPQEKPDDAAAKSEIARITRTLKKLNSYSSFLNVLTIMALTWHLVHLGQLLHTVC